ncbi:MAG: hypothetical protein WC548_00430 [Candidatus Pacearchaeota archaeon]
MKIWMIALALGLLLVVGFVVADSLLVEETEAETVVAPSCGSCNGGCSVGNSCSNPSCGINSGGSCGCKR